MKHELWDADARLFASMKGKDDVKSAPVSFFLLPLGDSSHFIAVFDGGFCLLYTGLEFAEPIGYTDSEVAVILGIDTPSNDVALCSAGVIMYILVEGGISHQPHGETVIAEE